MAVKYFRGIFGEEEPMNASLPWLFEGLDSTALSAICRQPDHVELKHVICSMEGLKLPGKDGFQPFFSKGIGIK